MSRKSSSEKVQQVSDGIVPRAIYENGAWNDGRLGQAYDLLAAVLQDHAGHPEKVFAHVLLKEIENLDEDLAQ
jgi:hypothetical protein